MPRIFGEGRPPGRERWVIHYDCMTEEDEEEMERWREELRKPITETDEFVESDAQPKGDCRNVINFHERAQIFRMRGKR